ncbi:hypothetical protein CDD83_350 [Cordyceps sp. RAO-2017]|nr:hypothetical protein CDD83_350 [Cordyceps sp. RAO-2017]
MPAVKDCLPPGLGSLLHYGAAADEASDEVQNETFERGTRCLEAFRAVVADYEASNRGSTGIRKPSKAHWEQDRSDLEALSDAAMATAFRVLNGLVMPRGKRGAMTEQERHGGDSDIDAMAAELLAEARLQPGDVAWGTVAHGFLRGFAGIVELLPEKEEA